jgi:AraC family L-rhamnose operon transcriptional activator RhaR
VAQNKVRHVSLDRFFREPKRIEANFVEDHPIYPCHDHEFMEVAVIVGGTCVHVSSLAEHRATSGDVFLFRPGAWHEYKQVKNLSLYNCCFDPALLGLELGWMVNDPLLGRLLWLVPLSAAQNGMVALHLGKAELARSQKILAQLCGVSALGLTANFGESLGLLVQFLSVIARNVPMERPSDGNVKIHPAVTAAIKMIDDNPAEPWTLPLLAEGVGLRSDYLCRLFSEIVGLSPISYLTRRRLEMATSLLRRTPLPVGEVGAAVGWLDANYFSRRFHDNFGISPSNYRGRFMTLQQRPRDESA